ncbi:hypothetical protein EDD11_000528 [Mortierella claussenii]|nr:hypothetical protein EDD11_000528 [Mortierella claussenii]
MVGLHRPLLGGHHTLAGPISKLGQENIPMTNAGSNIATADLLLRKASSSIGNAANAVHDKDPQRARIALLQKPPKNSSVQNIKAQSNLQQQQPSINAQQKVKAQQPAPRESVAPSPSAKPNVGNERQILSQTSRKPNSIAPSQRQAPAQGSIQTQPPYGSPLWIQNLVQTLPCYKFYFDGVDQSTAAKFTKILQIYNSSVTMFFSNEVTHIVTTSPIPSEELIARNKAGGDQTQAQASAQIPATSISTQGSSAIPQKLLPKASGQPPAPKVENSIFAKAKAFNCKIWSLERIQRLLRPLMGESAAGNESKNLQDYLRHEKTYGLATNHKDTSTKGDFYVFKGNYVLIEDTTGHYHTIMAHEYPPQKEGERRPWPGIYMQTTVRSPFTYHDLRPRRPRKHTGKDANDGKEPAADACVEADQHIAKDEGESVKGSQTKGELQRSPSALASGIVNSVMSTAVSTNSAVGKTKHQHGLPLVQDRVLEQLGKRVLNATKGEAGVAPNAIKTAEFVRPTNTAKSTRSIKPSTGRDAVPAKREPLAVLDANVVSSQKQTFAAPSTKTVATSASVQAGDILKSAPYSQRPIDVQKGTEAVVVVERTIHPKTPQELAKLGYCENCRRYYEDFGMHISTADHRRYAQDSSRFERLDKLLSKLQRKPRVASPEEPLISCSGVAHVKGRLESAAVAQEAEVVAKAIEDGSKTPSTHVVDAASAPMADREQTQPRIDPGTERTAGQFIPSAGGVTIANQDERLADTITQKNFVAESKSAVIECRVGQNEQEHAVEFKMEAEANTQAGPEATDSDNEDDDVSKVLSSEMGRLEVSETSQEHQGADEVQVESLESSASPINYPEEEEEEEEEEQVTEQDNHLMTETSPLSASQLGVATTKVQPTAKTQSVAPFSEMAFVFENNMTSHSGTDATQPDERFLGDSANGSQTTDSATPIRLSISMSSGIGVESSETHIKSMTNMFAVPEEGSSEGDRDDSDDAVALLKSPSAGRGAFARVQSADLRRTIGATIIAPNPIRDSYKRKMEIMLAEEREEEQAEKGWSRYGCSVGDTEPDTPHPVMYDETLRSGLLSQSGHHQQQSQGTQSRLSTWSSPAPPLHQLQTLPSVLPSVSQTTSSPVHFGYQQHASQVSPSSQFLRQSGSNSPYSSGQGSGVQQYYPDTSAHLSSYSIHNNPSQLQHLHRASIGTPSPLSHHSSIYQQPVQHCVPEGISTRYVDQDYISSPRASSVALGPTSPTSPLLHGQLVFTGSLSAPRSPHLVEPIFGGGPSSGSGSGMSSPPRSPSHRAAQRTQIQFPVMSHAEQERERCYHHYRGNQLPEPAGQKKMRTSSSLEEAFEEYGEGCMVYIE